MLDLTWIGRIWDEHTMLFILTISTILLLYDLMILTLCAHGYTGKLAKIADVILGLSMISTGLLILIITIGHIYLISITPQLYKEHYIFTTIFVLLNAGMILNSIYFIVTSNWEEKVNKLMELTLLMLTSLLIGLIGLGAKAIFSLIPNFIGILLTTILLAFGILQIVMFFRIVGEK